MKIRKDTTKENPHYLGYDEGHNGEFDNYFICPNCKKYNYLKINDTNCPVCLTELEWYSKNKKVSINEKLITKTFNEMFDRFYKNEFKPLNITEKKRRLLRYFNKYPTIIQELCDKNYVDFNSFKEKLI